MEKQFTESNCGDGFTEEQIKEMNRMFDNKKWDGMSEDEVKNLADKIMGEI